MCSIVQEVYSIVQEVSSILQEVSSILQEILHRDLSIHNTTNSSSNYYTHKACFASSFRDGVHHNGTCL